MIASEFTNVDLLMLLTILGLLIVLWRDSGNLDGHLRASAEVVLGLLRQPTSESQPKLDAEVAALLPGLGHVEGVAILAGSAAIGRSLAELDLHAQTGAAVLAIARSGGDLIRPEVEVRLERGDVVAVMGCSDAVVAALA